MEAAALALVCSISSLSIRCWDRSRITAARQTTIAFANTTVAEKGTFAGALCSGVDQRGLPRPVIFSSGNPGGRCDIGSIELQGPVGIAVLDPDNATFKKQEKFHLNYLRRVPPGENWHDIKSLDLRVRDDNDTLIWFR
jgi:hypothetical protein